MPKYMKSISFQAVEILNGKLMDGKTCIARQVIKKKTIPLPRTSISTVYVSNMDAVINEELLTEEFSVHGTVHGVNIIRNANGKSRGKMIIMAMIRVMQ